MVKRGSILLIFALTITLPLQASHWLKMYTLCSLQVLNVSCSEVHTGKQFFFFFWKPNLFAICSSTLSKWLVMWDMACRRVPSSTPLLVRGSGTGVASLPITNYSSTKSYSNQYGHTAFNSGAQQQLPTLTNSKVAPSKWNKHKEPGWLSRYSDRLRAGWQWYCSRKVKEIQLSLHQVLGALPGSKVAGSCSWPLQSNAEVKDGGAVPLLPHTSSWRGA
jgi:hypothetical protein